MSKRFGDTDRAYHAPGTIVPGDTMHVGYTYEQKAVANADGGLADEIDAARAEAVKGLRAYGYSWAEIGSRLGITRQAAQQRWG